MVVAAAREIKEVATAKDDKAILTGIGLPGLAAWLAFYLMKKEDVHIDLITGTGHLIHPSKAGRPFPR